MSSHPPPSSSRQAAPPRSPGIAPTKNRHHRRPLSQDALPRPLSHHSSVASSGADLHHRPFLPPSSTGSNGLPSDLPSAPSFHFSGEIPTAGNPPTPLPSTLISVTIARPSPSPVIGTPRAVSHGHLSPCSHAVPPCRPKPSARILLRRLQPSTNLLLHCSTPILRHLSHLRMVSPLRAIDPASHPPSNPCPSSHA